MAQPPRDDEDANGEPSTCFARKLRRLSVIIIAGAIAGWCSPSAQVLALQMASGLCGDGDSKFDDSDKNQLQAQRTVNKDYDEIATLRERRQSLLANS